MMKRIAIGALGLAACSTAVVKPEPARPAPAVVAAAPVVDASAPLAHQATIPELTPERFTVDGKAFEYVFGIEGATIVTRENVVGYIDGAKVEWIAKIPHDSFIGPTSIDDVRGKYLDQIDVYYSSMGRASLLTYLPLTGKGQKVEATDASVGGGASLLPARIGDSLIISLRSNGSNYYFATARGPAITRNFTSDAKCGSNQPLVGALVEPWALAATDDGTLVSIGGRCRNPKDVWAEIWDPGQSNSRVVDLNPLGDIVWKLTKVGNELWALRGHSGEPVVFRNGNFVAGPRLDSPIDALFVSPSRQLHAQTKDGTIHRLVDGAWQPVARLALPKDTKNWTLTVDANGTYWGSTVRAGAPRAEVFKFRETAQVPAAVECPSWVVSLPIWANNQPPNWQYPGTQKALRGYPAAARLQIVEYKNGYSTEVAIPVKSREEGNAVAPYLKEFRPHVICYTPPNVLRTIDVKP